MKSTLGLYQPGTSWLHRAPAWTKLLALFMIGAASVVIQGTWWWVLATFAVVGVVYLSAGLGLGLMWHQIRPMMLLMIVIAAMTWITATWQKAVAVPGMILVLVAVASLVTLTTRTTDLVDVLVRLFGVLRRFGVDPERVGLILLLGIRVVPLVYELSREISEAQTARGAVRDIRAFAVPLIVRALRDADAMGEALVARGFDD
ncbi:hypothetical protein HMPREF1531_01163 [Propionibacterium sp. oral taxon 192 str. F0372]|uniref:energy-coupling factor transporter transmembrane component T family protein n=1 Tax=Propionibacterium sp. oral taxon 192 TaxID=671222 RepID=UPI000353A8B0|nr:energy-coupling factor transporter transmembrane protein EcfT [Propionibacterium sp. oral taxon 192]EPH03738.1 hypothetical protein HMPREF1531_01163 [Propionibacterium sp. oral taxon 192 str. F0372]